MKTNNGCVRASGSISQTGELCDQIPESESRPDQIARASDSRINDLLNRIIDIVDTVDCRLHGRSENIRSAVDIGNDARHKVRFTEQASDDLINE